MSITPKIHLLKNHKFPSCNSLLINDQKVALVDSGLGRKQLQRILKELRVDILINSHTHPDHVAGNNIVCEMTKAEIFIPNEEQGNTKSLEKMKERLGVKGKDVEASWETIVGNDMGFQEAKRETPYKEGHVFDLGETQLESIHTPGHSPGHCCFLIKKEGLFFASDLGMDSFGPWYGYLNSSLPQFLSTIDTVQKIEFKRVLSSHSDTFVNTSKNGLEKSLSIIRGRERRIVQELESIPKTLEQMLKNGIIYNNLDNFKNPMKEFLTFFEKNMIQEHLRLLISQGKVKEERGYYIKA